MKLEWRAPIVGKTEWELMESTNLHDAAKEVAWARTYYDIQVRDAETKEAVELPAPYGYNGGTMCDVSSGPCACGAWH